MVRRFFTVDMCAKLKVFHSKAQPRIENVKEEKTDGKVAD